jgi:DNA-binding PadR family transcriptional regulator
MKGEANRKIPAPVARQIGLTPAVANRVRDALAQQGYIRVSRVKQTITYELTDAGREYLQTLTPYPPPEPEDETAEEIRGYQKAHLLLQLLRADQHALARGQANRSRGPADLELTTRAANRLRKRLAQEGLVEIIPGQRTESYRLTDRGRTTLGTLRHYPTSRITLTGKQLNALLHAGQRGANLNAGETQRAAQVPVSPAPLPADLGQVVYAEFVELRRERYGHTSLVPIHEIRRRIADKYGPGAARHDTLDEPIRELARQGKVRLVAISDLRDATEPQLADSIPGIDQTFFYLGVAHD